MDSIPPDLLGSLAPVVQQQLPRVFTEMEEEDLEVEAAWKRTAETFNGEISALTASNEADEAGWQVERASLLAAVEAAQEEERRRLQVSLLQMAQQAQEVLHQATLLRMARTQPESSSAQAEHSGRSPTMMGPRAEQLVLERVRAWSCPLVVDASSTAHKQQLMAELKEQAARWMEAPVAAGDSNTPAGDSSTPVGDGSTPVVFMTWGLREQWRKVQDNRPVLNDHLQAFLHKERIEQQLKQHVQKERELDAEFEKRRRSLEEKYLKKEEKQRAAAEEKKGRLEQQLRKEAEKRTRAAAKKQKKREEKEKKEEEKREEKEKKEEEKRTRAACKAQKKREEEERKEEEKAASLSLSRY
ncbi:GRB10-interacting GYF protein 2-like [Engraulis encrasicolus]|uniref:GRB10-interacting GYF protein 2-like n=1 Tax=Engraulis encrasicolus TaxID=184585 RepID=UPI002FD14340